MNLVDGLISSCYAENGGVKMESIYEEIKMRVNIGPGGAFLGAMAIGYAIGSDVDIDGVSDQVL